MPLNIAVELNCSYDSNVSLDAKYFEPDPADTHHKDNYRSDVESRKDDREALISQITGFQHRIAARMAYTRSIPLLLSTLTMQQLKTLVILSKHSDASGHDLAKHLGVTLATVTGIIDRMVIAGLVSRREDPTDRRVRRVSLTTEGTELLQRITDTGATHMQQLLTELDTQSLRDLAAVVEKMWQIAQRIEPEATD